MMALGPELCETLVAVGRLDEAERYIEESLAVSRVEGAVYCEATARRARGELLVARGLDADSEWQAAIDAFAAQGSRLDLAWTLVGRGRARLAGGAAEDGRADLEQARALFTATDGARGLREVATLLDDG